MSLFSYITTLVRVYCVERHECLFLYIKSVRYFHNVMITDP